MISGGLPRQFIMRLDELSQVNLMLGMVESMTKISTVIGEAKQFMWGISPESLLQPLDAISKQIPKGCEYRVLSPQPPMKTPSLENRTLFDPPLIMALTEKYAAVCFRQIGGKVDYASFFGDDIAFHGWARDLFLYLWEKRTMPKMTFG